MKSTKRLTVLLVLGFLSFILLLKPDDLIKDQSGMNTITGEVSIDIVGGNVIVSRDHHEPKPIIIKSQNYNFIPALLFISSIALINMYFYRRRN
jgi:hypothetical protein